MTAGAGRGIVGVVKRGAFATAIALGNVPLCDPLDAVRSVLVDASEYGLEAPEAVEILIDRFLEQAEFPAQGKVVVEMAQRNGAPEHVVRVLRRLIPAKVFHNTFEVWFDAVHPPHSRAR
jgi:hypothetical protein